MLLCPRGNSPSGFGQRTRPKTRFYTARLPVFRTIFRSTAAPSLNTCSSTAFLCPYPKKISSQSVNPAKKEKEGHVGSPKQSRRETTFRGRHGRSTCRDSSPDCRAPSERASNVIPFQYAIRVWLFAKPDLLYSHCGQPYCFNLRHSAQPWGTLPKIYRPNPSRISDVTDGIRYPLRPFRD